MSSPQFTEGTFSVLVLFHQNVSNLANVVFLEGVLLDKKGR